MHIAVPNEITSINLLATNQLDKRYMDRFLVVGYKTYIVICSEKWRMGPSRTRKWFM